MTDEDHAIQLQRVKEADGIQRMIQSWVSLRESINQAKGFGISSFPNDHRLSYVTSGPISVWQDEMCSTGSFDSQIIKKMFDTIKTDLLVEIDRQVQILQAKYAGI